MAELVIQLLVVDEALFTDLSLQFLFHSFSLLLQYHSIFMHLQLHLILDHLSKKKKITEDLGVGSEMFNFMD